MDACRNNKGIPPLIQRWREDDYTWAGPKVWACFRPDADVLVPMYYNSPEAGIVSPFAGERDISMLMRFAYEKGDGKNLVEHFGHRLRYELLEQWKADPLHRSEQGLATPEVSRVLNQAFCSCGFQPARNTSALAVSSCGSIESIVLKCLRVAHLADTEQHAYHAIIQGIPTHGLDWRMVVLRNLH